MEWTTSGLRDLQSIRWGSWGCSEVGAPGKFGRQRIFDAEEVWGQTSSECTAATADIGPAVSAVLT